MKTMALSLHVRTVLRCKYHPLAATEGNNHSHSFHQLVCAAVGEGGIRSTVRATSHGRGTCSFLPPGYRRRRRDNIVVNFDEA